MAEQTSSRVPPHDLEAEEAVLGSCLLSSHQIEPCSEIVTPGDFYRPGNGLVWESMLNLWGEGVTPDPVAVGGDLKRRKLIEQTGGSQRLLELMAKASATSTAPQKARIVADLAGLRRVAGLAGEVTSMVYDGWTEGAGSLIDWTHARLDEVEIGAGQVPDTFTTLDGFLERPEAEHAEWVIPGQMRARWRAVFVAGEGVGKSVLLRQVAIAASQGLHPFVPGRRIRPIRALVVDLENPDEAIEEQVALVLDPVWRELGEPSNWLPDNIALLREEGGLNLRTRRDRSRLEAVLSTFRPQLVVAGPAYKMYELEGGEKHEQGVHQVHRVWDKWRTRYGFALMIEHHAPMGGGPGGRQIRPADTMLWLRWPEFGFSLTEKKRDEAPGTFKWGRNRGDRVTATWPEKMLRGRPGEWPWQFTWPTGTFQDRGAEPELF